MNMLRRREMLRAIAQLALGSALAGCGRARPLAEPGSVLPESDVALLAALAYDLFPFPDLTPELYLQVGERLLHSGGPAVAAGLLQLREMTGNIAWRDLDEPRRIAALMQLQSGPFFARLRATAIEVLYRAPETFALVNYGGSAIEYGGTCSAASTRSTGCRRRLER